MCEEVFGCSKCTHERNIGYFALMWHSDVPRNRIFVFYALLWHENCGNSVVSEYVPCHATAKTVNVHDCAHIWTAAYMHVGADNKRVLTKAKTLMAEDTRFELVRLLHQHAFQACAIDH